MRERTREREREREREKKKKTKKENGSESVKTGLWGVVESLGGVGESI